MQHPVKKKIVKKRKWIVPTVLGVGLLLAGGILFRLPALKEKAKNDAMPAAVAQRQKTLHQADAAELISVVVRPAEGEAYTLLHQDGKLLLKRDSGVAAVSEAAQDEILEAVTCLAVSGEIAEDAVEVEEYFRDMGLAPAQIVVQAFFSDGGDYTLEIGAEVPETTYRYYRWSGDPGVYMCDVGVGEIFSMTPERLLPVEQPELVASLVEALELENKNGVLELRIHQNGDGVRLGELNGPLSYPMDASTLETVLNALDGFRLGTPLGELNEETSREYGFDQPIAILSVRQQDGWVGDVDENGRLYSREVEGRLLRFTFGRADGDFFYTCEYEGSIYRVSRFLAETLVAGGFDKWRARRPADLGDASLRSVLIQTGSGSLEMRRSRTERVLPNNELETDADGALVYDELFTLDGGEATQEQWDGLISRLAAMTVSGTVPEGFSVEGKTPRWQILLTAEDGTERSIAAYPLDAFTDALSVNGAILDTVYIEALDSALGELRPRPAS